MEADFGYYGAKVESEDDFVQDYPHNEYKNEADYDDDYDYDLEVEKDDVETRFSSNRRKKNSYKRSSNQKTSKGRDDRKCDMPKSLPVQRLKSVERPKTNEEKKSYAYNTTDWYTFFGATLLWTRSTISTPFILPDKAVRFRNAQHYYQYNLQLTMEECRANLLQKVEQNDSTARKKPLTLVLLGVTQENGDHFFMLHFQTTFTLYEIKMEDFRTGCAFELMFSSTSNGSNPYNKAFSTTSRHNFDRCFALMFLERSQSYIFNGPLTLMIHCTQCKTVEDLLQRYTDQFQQGTQWEIQPCGNLSSFQRMAAVCHEPPRIAFLDRLLGCYVEPKQVKHIKFTSGSEEEAEESAQRDLQERDIFDAQESVECDGGDDVSGDAAVDEPQSQINIGKRRRVQSAGDGEAQRGRRSVAVSSDSADSEPEQSADDQHKNLKAQTATTSNSAAVVALEPTQILIPIVAEPASAPVASLISQRETERLKVYQSIERNRAAKEKKLTSATNLTGISDAAIATAALPTSQQLSTSMSSVSKKRSCRSEDFGGPLWPAAAAKRTVPTSPREMELHPLKMSRVEPQGDNGESRDSTQQSIAVHGISSEEDGATEELDKTGEMVVPLSAPLRQGKLVVSRGAKQGKLVVSRGAKAAVLEQLSSSGSSSGSSDEESDCVPRAARNYSSEGDGNHKKNRGAAHRDADKRKATSAVSDCDSAMKSGSDDDCDGDNNNSGTRSPSSAPDSVAVSEQRISPANDHHNSSNGGGKVLCAEKPSGPLYLRLLEETEGRLISLHFVKRLNASQQTALEHCTRNILHQERARYSNDSSHGTSISERVCYQKPLCGDLTLVQGPPGCGKTHLLSSLLHVISAAECRILVCAPSNKAVCVALEKFVATGGNRLGLNLAIVGVEDKIDSCSSTEFHAAAEREHNTVCRTADGVVVSLEDFTADHDSVLDPPQCIQDVFAVNHNKRIAKSLQTAMLMVRVMQDHHKDAIAPHEMSHEAGRERRLDSTTAEMWTTLKKIAVRAETHFEKLLDAIRNRIPKFAAKYTNDEVAGIKAQFDILFRTIDEKIGICNAIAANSTAFQSKVPLPALAYNSINHIAEELRMKVQTLHGLYSQPTYALQICDEYVTTADILFCTLATSGNIAVTKNFKHIDVLIVDEAAQSFEPEMLIPLALKPENMIMIGDPKQLPATIISTEIQRMDLGHSAMQRLMEGCDVPRCLLSTQFRMHPAIAAFSNKHFYEGRIEDSEHVRTRPGILPHNKHCELGHDLRHSQQQTSGQKSVKSGSNKQWHHNSYCFVNVDGVEKGSHFSSMQNESEAELVLDIVKFLKSPACGLSVGRQVNIISFYAGQVACIKALLKKHRLDSEFIKVLSVDSFQGSECDVCILSFVRGRNANTVGFVKEYQRLNVALTRAKYLHISVGCASTLARFRSKSESAIKGHKDALCEMVRDCRDRGVLFEEEEVRSAMAEASNSAAAQRNAAVQLTSPSIPATISRSSGGTVVLRDVVNDRDIHEVLLHNDSSNRQRRPEQMAANLNMPPPGGTAGDSTTWYSGENRGGSVQAQRRPLPAAELTSTAEYMSITRQNFGSAAILEITSSNASNALRGNNSFGGGVGVGGVGGVGGIGVGVGNYDSTNISSQQNVFRNSSNGMGSSCGMSKERRVSLPAAPKLDCFGTNDDAAAAPPRYFKDAFKPKASK